MKIFSNNIFRASMVGVVLLASSCQITDMEVQDNPNALTPEKADVNLFMNSVQLGVANIWQAGNAEGMELTRMMTMFGPTYQAAYSPETFDGIWTTAYAGVLQDIEAGLAYTDDLPNHRAVFKIMKAYTYFLLVDSFGDVPFSEANLGSANLAPGLDDDEAVYAAMIDLLDEAIADLSEESPFMPDFDFFASNADDADYRDFYTRLANTLKLRAHLNTGDAAAFTALLSEDLIDDPSYDFQFRYGSNLANPGTRHPQFGANYDNGAALGTYQSNSFMNRFLSTTDPRIRYYFYRQETSNSTAVNEVPCRTQLKPAWYAPEDVFCQLTGGYWGRDHGNDDGIPPDTFKRTIWGVYPVGGQFDNNNDVNGEQDSGGKGAGISPMLLSFFVDFMRAEAAITLGTGEDARALLSSAIDGSMSKVSGFAASIGYSLAGLGQVPAAAAFTTYRDNVLTAYDDAADDAERLEIIAVEYYKALYGNGHDAYNLYRRTGYPSDMQPAMKTSDPGDFIRSFWLPAVTVNRNSSVGQKSLSDPVFWDPNFTLN